MTEPVGSTDTYLCLLTRRIVSVMKKAVVGTAKVHVTPRHCSTTVVLTATKISD